MTELADTNYLRNLDDDLARQWERQTLAADTTDLTAPSDFPGFLAAAILFTTTPTDRALAGWNDSYSYNSSVQMLGWLGGLNDEEVHAHMNRGTT